MSQEKQLVELIDGELKQFLGLDQDANLEKHGSSVQRAMILIALLRQNEKYCKEMLQYANMQNAQIKVRELQLSKEIEQFGGVKNNEFKRKGFQENKDDDTSRQEKQIQKKAIIILESKYSLLEKQLKKSNGQLFKLKQKNESLVLQVERLKKQKQAEQIQLQEKRKNQNYFVGKQNQLNSEIRKLKLINQQQKEKYQAKFLAQMQRVLQQNQKKYAEKQKQNIMKYDNQIKQLEGDIETIINKVNEILQLNVVGSSNTHDWIKNLQSAVKKYDIQMKSFLNQKERNSSNRILAYARFQKERLGSYRYYQTRTFLQEPK